MFFRLSLPFSLRLSQPLLALALLATAWASLAVRPAPVDAQQVAVSEAAHQQFVFAYRLLQKGDTKLAIEAFDEYLGKFPQDEKLGDALYFRALLAKQENQTLKAHEYLARQAPAPTLVPQAALLLLKGEIAADLQLYKEALQSLEKIDLKQLEPSLQASALFLRGQAYRGTKNLAAAAAQFEASAKIDSPLRPRAQLELARVLAQDDKYAPAVEAAKAAATAGDPLISPQAARYAGDYTYQLGQYAQAIDFYNLVITNYSTSFQMSPAVLGSMWAMLGMKQYPQIITSFEKYKAQLSPADRVVAWYLTGTAYQEQDEHDKAAGLFNALVLGSTSSPVEDKAMYKLAYSQAELGQYEQALQTTARLREKHPDSPLVVDSDFLLASVDIKRGDPSSAIGRVTRVIEQGPQNPYHAQALLLRARFLESIDQIDKASADYAAFIQAAANPKPPQRNISQADIHEAALRRFDLEYQQQRYKQAAQAVQTLLAMKQLPESVVQEATYRQALAMIRLEQYPQAQEVLTRIIEHKPVSVYQPQASYYRGLVRIALKQPATAMTDLQAAAGAEALPAALKINALRLISIHQRQQDQVAPAAATIIKLEALAGLSGLSAGELLWVGRHRLTQNQPKAALKYLQPIVARQTEAPIDQRAEALLLTGKALRQLDDLPAAITAFRQAISTGQGDHAQARLQLASALAADGQMRDAMDEYVGLVNSQQSAVAAAALDQMASLHIQHAQRAAQTNDPAGSHLAWEEARKTLKRLILLYSFPELSPLPEQSHVRLAQVHEALNQPQQAAEALRELASRYPDTSYAAYAQAAMLALEGRTPQARAEALALFNKMEPASLDPVLASQVQRQRQQLEATP